MNNRELTKKLKDLQGLEAAGTPQQGWILSNREVLMNQISPKAKVRENSREFGSAVYYFQYFGQFFNQRILKPVAVSLAVVFVLVSYTATVSVADASLPGDMLYPIKTTRERVKLALTFKEEEKVKLQMDYVSRRVDELQGLVAKGDDSSNKSENVASTAKKISDDVKSIKDGLNKITIAGNAVKIAKDIDSKTLAVGHGLKEVKEALAPTVNVETIDNINNAIDDTENVGTAALVVIINKFEEGNNEDITDDELVSRVAERIKNVESDIQSADNEKMKIGGKMSINPEENVELSAPSSTDTTITSTVDVNIDNSDNAQTGIEEAKDLLDKNKYSLAIEKLMQASNIIGSEDKAGEVKGDFEAVDATTTTDEMTDVNSKESGSKAGTSEGVE